MSTCLIQVAVPIGVDFLPQLEREAHLPPELRNKRVVDLRKLAKVFGYRSLKKEML